MRRRIFCLILDQENMVKDAKKKKKDEERNKAFPKLKWDQILQEKKRKKREKFDIYIYFLIIQC